MNKSTNRKYFCDSCVMIVFSRKGGGGESETVGYRYIRQNLSQLTGDYRPDKLSVEAKKKEKKAQDIPVCLS